MNFDEVLLSGFSDELRRMTLSDPLAKVAGKVIPFPRSMSSRARMAMRGVGSSGGDGRSLDIGDARELYNKGIAAGATAGTIGGIGIGGMGDRALRTATNKRRKAKREAQKSANLEKDAGLGSLLGTGTSRLMQAAGQSGLGDVAGKALKASKSSAQLQAWGKNMAATPVQRVRAAGLKVLPGEGAGLTQAAERMGTSSSARRIIGGAAEGAGHHMAHKSMAGMMLNPLGVPLGGAIEGATRQAGKELTNQGVRGAGRLMQQHAGKAGLAGEIAGMAGLGTAVHAPLSSAGALGTAALHGIGVKGGLASALGQYGAHGVADAVGTAMHSGAGRLGRAAMPVVGAAKRMLSTGVG